MTVEVRPLGVKCNIKCKYCYQEPQRNARNILHKFDMPRMKEAIIEAVAETGVKTFTVFGGEPLLVPIEELEELWSWGYSKFGRNQVQTNGTLISDKHIELFNKYNVKVGISVDGPDKLNDARWIHSLEKTRESSGRTHKAIKRLCAEGTPPSLIITLTRANALPEYYSQMNDWFLDLEKEGVRSVRLHILEVDDPLTQRQLAMSSQENTEAFLNFFDLEKQQLKTLRFDLYREMRQLLLGDDNKSTCVWKGCDPLTTRAVRGIEGNGQLSNCGRTNKEGIDFVKSSVPGYERYIALYNTPQENGGCQSCRYFLMCKGQCPGTAINGDWRNRSEHCETWKGLFSVIEQNLLSEGELPLSTVPARKKIEQAMLDSWVMGKNPSVSYVLERSMRK